MAESAATALDRLADAWPDAERSSAWQQCSLRLPAQAPEDLGRMLEVVSTGAAVTALVGIDERPIRLGVGPATPDERDLAAGYLPDNRKGDTSDASQTELVGMVQDHVIAWHVKVTRPHWAPDLDALKVAVVNDWLGVASVVAAAGCVQVGDVRHEVEVLTVPWRDDEQVLVGVPMGTPIGPARILGGLADAHGWWALAWDRKQVNNRHLIALHRDQRAEIRVAPGRAQGGADLLRWLADAPDRSAEQAMRAELRRATAASGDALPDGAVIVALAEQLRVAMASENIVAVHAVVARRTQEAHEAVSSVRTLRGEAVRSAVRSAQAVVLASIGLAAFLVRTTEDIPVWLLVFLALAAIASLVVGQMAESSQLCVATRAVDSVRDGIGSDKLLPGSAKEEILAGLDGLDRSPPVAAWAVTALACLLVLVTALWAMEPAEPPVRGPDDASQSLGPSSTTGRTTSRDTW